MSARFLALPGAKHFRSVARNRSTICSSEGLSSPKRIASASAARPARIARKPHFRPITSTRKTRRCARAVSAMRSHASTIVFTAVSTPIARPV